MKIGVISDTHGYLDPKVPPLFEGVSHILHAGDIGPPSILSQLESIAPVTAVYGNTDAPWPGLRETEFIALNGLGFLVHHIVAPEHPSDLIQRRLAMNSPNAIVFGHTHKPYSRSLGGVLFFNPGYAGRPRFDLPRSVAVLHLRPEAGDIKDELIWL
jgi:uncharacterized protein